MGNARTTSKSSSRRRRTSKVHHQKVTCVRPGAEFCRRRTNLEFRAGLLLVLKWDMLPERVLGSVAGIKSSLSNVETAGPQSLTEKSSSMCVGNSSRKSLVSRDTSGGGDATRWEGVARILAWRGVSRRDGSNEGRSKKLLARI